MLLQNAMKRARWFACGVKRSIALALVRRAQEWPDLHQTSLLAKFVAADGDGIENAAVAYFGKALSSAGFMTADDIPQIIADYMEQKQAWCHALVAEAEEQRRVGLSVYAMRTGPLEGGLDWANLPTDKYGDRLYQLRPHRFGFAPRLAMAASCGADTLPELLATLDGWVALVDSRQSSNAYFSNLVIIYRLLAISWTVPFCVAMARNGNNTAAAICLRMFQILAADARYLWPRLGDSAANNHVLADRFAAWFVATCYPDFCPKADVGELERVWQDELCQQFHADGTNFEQSVHYHELGCELALAYLVISLRKGKQPDKSIAARIREMLRFQAALADDCGNSFSLGDATDDPLLPLDAGAGSAGGAWRVVYRSLFDISFPATSDQARGAERAFWLLAPLSHIEKPLRMIEPPAPVGNFVVFPDGGYVVLHDDYRDQRILFRTGPRPGIPVHFGHAMADLLSVYWTVGGQPVMEPSGTFSYATSAGQANSLLPRNYFRSPAASNGIVLRGHDPLGSPTGRFRIRDNGTRVAPRWRSLENLMSWAEGRLEEDGPLNGHRRGVLHIFGHYTLVYDHLPALLPETVVSSHWQLAPEVTASIIDWRLASVSLTGASAFICVDGGGAAMACAQAQIDPMAGWVSRSYGQMHAAPQLLTNLLPTTRDLGFLFGLGDWRDGTPSVEMRHVGQDGMILDIRRGHHRGIACIGSVSAGRGVLPFDLDFQGDALWLDVEHDTLCEIRALGLRGLRSHALNLDLAPGATVAENWLLLAHRSEDAGVSGRWELKSAR